MADAELIPLSEALALGAQAWEKTRLGGAGTVFGSWDWWRAWADTASPGERQRALAAVVPGDAGRVGVIPLSPDRTPRGRLAGAFTWAGGDFGCPDRLDLPIHSSAAAMQLREVLSRHRCGVFRLDNLAAEAPGATHLADALVDAGWQVAVHDLHACPYLELPGSWPDYLATMSGKSRQTLRRKLRVIERRHDVQLHLHHEDRSVRRGFEDLVALHEARWHGQGVFSNPRIRRFHAALIERLAERGQLWLSSLTVDGETVAAFYGFVAGGVLAFYQSGRRPDRRRLSAGTVLMAHTIRQAIDRRLTGFDFLRGDEPYKSRWGPDERRTRRLLAFDTSVRGRMASTANRLYGTWGRQLRAVSRPTLNAVRETILG